MNTIRVFLSKIRTLFSIWKIAGQASSLPLSCAPVMCYWIYISINIIYKCWNRFFDYARALNMHDQITSPSAWTWLTIAECPLICLKIPEETVLTVTVLNMPQYSYNNITIAVTNIIMLELFSARFIHPVPLLPFLSLI